VGRLSRRTTTVGSNYLTDYGYSSATGLLESLTYPASTGGYRLKLRYDYQNGYLKKISDFNASSTVFWEAAATDARGNVVDETLGNGLRTIRGYDPVTGWLDHIETGPGGGTLRQNLEYQWDRVGNLTQRKDVNRTLTEDFEYDNLHRLDRSLRNGTQNLDLSYDLLGNITYKSDVGGGTWSYHASKKNAVTNAAGNVYGYDANGNQTSRNGQSVTWTSYNYPKRVNHASGVYHEFSYGPDRQRYQQVYKNGGTTETTVLIGGLLEKRTLGSVTEYRHHIQVGGRPVALYTRPTSGSITTEYFLTDHLGSIDAVTTASGALFVGESFSAFGERRDPNDWSGPPSSLDLNKIAGVTQRGYTGHTNLEQGSLIHMNGRIADAKTGRFLSADPFVPDPGLTQALNRYSYVYNRPMSFTDPSGFEPLFTVSVIGTVASFGKWLFGKKKSPPKGCFVAPTGCYGQAGVPRTPGFNSLVASGWENQPPWILNADSQLPNGSPPYVAIYESNVLAGVLDIFRDSRRQRGTRTTSTLEDAVQRAIITGRGVRSQIEAVRRGILEDQYYGRLGPFADEDFGGIIYREEVRRWFRTVAVRYRYPVRIDEVYGHSGFNNLIGEQKLQTPNGRIDTNGAAAVVINRVPGSVRNVLSEYGSFARRLGVPVYVDTNETVFVVEGETCTVFQGTSQNGC